MDESLAVALRVFLRTIEPRVLDPPMQRAIEKVDGVMARVADGALEPCEAASYIREVVKVIT